MVQFIAMAARWIRQEANRQAWLFGVLIGEALNIQCTSLPSTDHNVMQVIMEKEITNFHSQVTSIINAREFCLCNVLENDKKFLLDLLRSYRQDKPPGF